MGNFVAFIADRELEHNSLRMRRTMTVLARGNDLMFALVAGCARHAAMFCRTRIQEADRRPVARTAEC